jgi:predicted ABC-type transport system involved in lysophospholipase L1 biosynthesis ATPase subunit
VAELLLALHQQQQTVLLVVTHSEALATRFARRWRIERGQLITDGAGASPADARSGGRGR